MYRSYLCAFAPLFAFALSASAVEPTIMWDGAAPGYKFDNLTRVVGDNTFTLNVNPVTTDTPNTVAADSSYIQIGNKDAQPGVTITVQNSNPAFTNGFGNGVVSVIMRCRNMPASTGSNRAIMTLMDGNKYKYGSTSGADNGAVLGFYNNSGSSGWIWKGSTATNAHLTGSFLETVSGKFSSARQIVAMTYSHGTTEGTAYYVDGVLAQSQTGLRANELDNNLYGISLGGVDVATGSQFFALKGMKIDAIAVFSNMRLTEEQVKSFRFPSVWASEVNAEFGDDAKIDLQVAADAVIVGDTTFNANKINFISAGSITITPPLNNTTTFDFSGVEGETVVKYKGLVPTASGDKFTSTTVPEWVTNEVQWAGTISISDFAPTTSDTRGPLYPFKLNTLGNANSTVKLSSIGSATSKMAYLPPIANGYTNVAEVSSKVVLKDDGGTPALRLSDGVSAHCTIFREIAGDGTLTQIKGDIYQGVTINVMTNFTGTLSLNQMTVTFGTATRAGQNADKSSTPYKSGLFIDPDAILSIPAGFELWSPAKVEINGPVDFRTDAPVTDGLVLLSGLGENAEIKSDASFTINGTPVEHFSCKVKIAGTKLQVQKRIGKRFILR